MIFHQLGGPTLYLNIKDLKLLELLKEKFSNMDFFSLTSCLLLSCFTQQGRMVAVALPVTVRLVV